MYQHIRGQHANSDCVFNQTVRSCGVRVEYTLRTDTCVLLMLFASMDIFKQIDAWNVTNECKYGIFGSILIARERKNKIKGGHELKGISIAHTLEHNPYTIRYKWFGQPYFVSFFLLLSLKLSSVII